MRGALPPVLDREGLRIGSEALEQSEDTAPADFKDGKQVADPDLSLEIPPKKIPDLGVSEGLVKLFRHDGSSIYAEGYIRPKNDSPLLNFISPQNSPLSMLT
jgi:hypothetical protein